MSSLDCSISHIFREINFCADKLANFSVSSMTSSWWNEISNFVLNEFSRN
ncbi:hypothetical protein Lalb_Chr24g0403531 [Lupinus albus]|uniref:RNase H type-1 domain-containing protein n=1 Tax=Lupinus albus TaxID=3870 RepID=A0A6A4N5H5_LUPAL|nr:hypothetical protein Lalb_Chr24g0403531 [Lupinus albus]